MSKTKTYILLAVAIVIGLIGGYFWGRHTAASAARAGFAGGAGAFSSSTRSRFAGAGGTAAGGALTVGQVTAMSSSSFTLQLANGNSEVVFYSSSTAVTEPTVVPVSELKTGSNVTITGTTNSDGSVSAESIQVRAATGSGGSGTMPTTSATAQ